MTLPALVPPTSYGDPDLDLAGELNQHLLVLTRTMHTIKTAAAARSNDGVSWSTYVLLFHLIAGGPMRTKALAASVGLDPSTISRQVDELVRLGHVERHADPDDGRAIVLVATDRGRETHRRMREQRDRLTARVVDGWDRADTERLTELVGRLAADMQAALPTVLTAIAAGAADPQETSA
jgi:DNA-binding MarR family transcriptional regulator